MMLRMSLNIATMCYLESSHFHFGRRSVKHSKGDTLKTLRNCYRFENGMWHDHTLSEWLVFLNTSILSAKAIHFKLK